MFLWEWEIRMKRLVLVAAAVVPAVLCMRWVGDCVQLCGGVFVLAFLLCPVCVSVEAIDTTQHTFTYAFAPVSIHAAAIPGCSLFCIPSSFLCIYLSKSWRVLCWVRWLCWVCPPPLVPLLEGVSVRPPGKPPFLWGFQAMQTHIAFSQLPPPPLPLLFGCLTAAAVTTTTTSTTTHTHRTGPGDLESKV